jgi:hypothetical protein
VGAGPRAACARKERLNIFAGMKNAIFSVFYTLGLSAFWPLLIANHRSSAALPMFLAPLVAVGLAELCARTIRISEERTENKVIWLIAAFILLSQVAKYALELDATDGFTEYLALNALYQIVLILIFAASKRRGTKRPDLSAGQLPA